MKKMHVYTAGLALLAAVLITTSAFARRDRVDFAEGVTFGEANPTPDAVTSNINDYINQDEQINIAPNDGTVKVLRTDQKILINDFVTAIIPCKNVVPREIRGPIRTMVRKEGGEADVMQDKETQEYFMHVVCPAFQLPYIEAVIQGLDEDWVMERRDGSAELYYKGKFRDIRDIQRISQFYIGPEGQGRFFFDDLNNAMYYTDQPALIGLQNWGLGQIDIPPNQVELEVAIYEIDMNNDTMLGLDWEAYKNGPGRHLFEFDYFSEKSNSDVFTNGTGAGTDTSREFSNISLNAVGASQFFDFVQNKGYVRELVKTNITVKSGDPALIEAVDALAQFASEPRHELDSRQEETVTDPDGDTVTVQTPQNRGRLLHYREAGDKVGLRLQLVPYVARESMELDVSVDVSSVNGYTPSGNPILGVKSISDYVRLANGEPMMMGGIDRQTMVRRKNGVPFLHKLPAVGWLFGSELNVKRDTRLVIIVTPRFMLGAESDLEMPMEMQTIIGQAKGEEEIRIPKNPFGYDQWLLDN